MFVPRKPWTVPVITVLVTVGQAQSGVDFGDDGLGSLTGDFGSI